MSKIRENSGMGRLHFTKKWGATSYCLPALTLLVICFLVPMAGLFLRSVLDPSFGFGNYETLMSSQAYVSVLKNTFVVAGIVTVFTILLGFPTAWGLVIMPPFWAAAGFGILVLSMWTNLLVRTYAWMVLLQTRGVLNKLMINIGIRDEPIQMVHNLAGVIIGMTYIMLPFVILPLIGALRGFDKSLLHAGSICGASKWDCFWRILIPQTLPSIVSGALVVFIMSLGYYVTPALLGSSSTMMIGELIALFVQSMLDWGLSAAAAFVLLTLTLAIYYLQFRLFGSFKPSQEY